MKELETLQAMGVTIKLTKDGKLKVHGHGDSEAAISYVREHKGAIINALKCDMPNPSLPVNCPFNTGVVPVTCRFDPGLYKQLTGEGVLPVDGSCPLRPVCEFLSSKRPEQSSNISPKPPLESSDQMPELHKPLPELRKPRAKSAVTIQKKQRQLQLPFSQPRTPE